MTGLQALAVGDQDIVVDLLRRVVKDVKSGSEKVAVTVIDQEGPQDYITELGLASQQGTEQSRKAMHFVVDNNQWRKTDPLVACAFNIPSRNVSDSAALKPYLDAFFSAHLEQNDTVILTGWDHSQA